jgi:hypothetical protein
VAVHWRIVGGILVEALRLCAVDDDVVRVFDDVRAAIDEFDALPDAEGHLVGQLMLPHIRADWPSRASSKLISSIGSPSVLLSLCSRSDR